jgi:hypothetical protein
MVWADRGQYSSEVGQGAERQPGSWSGQTGVNIPVRWGKVQNGSQAHGLGRQNGKNKKTGARQEQQTNAGRFTKTKQTGNRQTENTGINTQG